MELVTFSYCCFMLMIRSFFSTVYRTGLSHQTDAQNPSCPVNRRVPEVVCGQGSGMQPCPSGSVCYLIRLSRTGYCCKIERGSKKNQPRTGTNKSAYFGINTPCSAPLMHGGNLLTCSPGQRARTCPQPCFTCVPLLGTIVGICCEDRKAVGCGTPGFMTGVHGSEPYSESGNAMQQQYEVGRTAEERDITNIYSGQIYADDRTLDRQTYESFQNIEPTKAPIRYQTTTRQIPENSRLQISTNQNDYYQTNGFAQQNTFQSTPHIGNIDNYRSDTGGNKGLLNNIQTTSRTMSQAVITQTYPDVRKGYIDEPNVQSPTTSRAIVAAQNGYQSTPSPIQQSLNTIGRTSSGAEVRSNTRLQTRAPSYLGQVVTNYMSSGNIMNISSSTGLKSTQSQSNYNSSYTNRIALAGQREGSPSIHATNAPSYSTDSIYVEGVHHINNHTVTNHAFTVGTNNVYPTQTTKSNNNLDKGEPYMLNSLAQPNMGKRKMTTSQPLTDMELPNLGNGNSAQDFNIEIYPNNEGISVNQPEITKRKITQHTTPSPMSSIDSVDSTYIKEAPHDNVYIQQIGTTDVTTHAPVTTPQPVVSHIPVIMNRSVSTVPTPNTVRIEVPATRDNVYLLLQRLGIDDISPGYIHTEQRQQQNANIAQTQATSFFGNRLNTINGVPISGQSLNPTRSESTITGNPCGGPQPVAICLGPTNIQCGTGYYCVRTDASFGVCCQVPQASSTNQNPLVSNTAIRNPCGIRAPVSACLGPNNLQCAAGTRCIRINGMVGFCCLNEQDNNVPVGVQPVQNAQASYPIVPAGNPDDPCGGVEPQSMCLGPTNMQCPLGSMCVQIEPRFGVCCPASASSGATGQNNVGVPIQRRMWPSAMQSGRPQIFFGQPVQGQGGGTG